MPSMLLKIALKQQLKSLKIRYPTLHKTGRIQCETGACGARLGGRGLDRFVRNVIEIQFLPPERTFSTTKYTRYTVILWKLTSRLPIAVFQVSCNFLLVNFRSLCRVAAIAPNVAAELTSHQTGKNQFKASSVSRNGHFLYVPINRSTSRLTGKICTVKICFPEITLFKRESPLSESQ